MEGGKKVFLRRFLADQKIASSWKKCVLEHPVGRFRTFARHRLSPLPAFTSGAYFLHDGRR